MPDEIVVVVPSEVFTGEVMGNTRLNINQQAKDADRKADLISLFQTFNPTEVLNVINSLGLSIFNVDKPYDAPNAIDEEFTSSVLDAKWSTATDGGTPSSNAIQTGLSSVRRIVPNHATLPFFVYQAAPSGTYKVRAKIAVQKSSSGNVFGGLGFRTSGSTFSAIGIKVTSGGGPTGIERFDWSPITVLQGETAIFNTAVIKEFIYYEIEQTATDVILRASIDGFVFNAEMIYSGNVANRIGIAGFGVGGAVLVDWFRKVDASGFTGK